MPPTAITRGYTAAAGADSLSHLQSGVRWRRMGAIAGHPRLPPPICDLEAAALGLTVPGTLLAIADEVIE